MLLESVDGPPLEVEWIRERMLRDCITIRPAMMALVVAIAGMILPAISIAGMSIDFFPLCDKQLAFDLETSLIGDTVSGSSKVSCRKYKVKSIVIILVKGQRCVGKGECSSGKPLAAIQSAMFKYISNLPVQEQFQILLQIQLFLVLQQRRGFTLVPFSRPVTVRLLVRHRNRTEWWGDKRLVKNGITIKRYRLYTAFLFPHILHSQETADIFVENFVEYSPRAVLFAKGFPYLSEGSGFLFQVFNFLR